MPKIEFVTLETPEPPKEVLERDFPDLPPLRIRGGWGYDMESACIIETPDDPDFPLDGWMWNSPSRNVVSMKS